jgi:hypothetical protein
VVQLIANVVGLRNNPRAIELADFVDQPYKPISKLLSLAQLKLVAM